MRFTVYTLILLVAFFLVSAVSSVAEHAVWHQRREINNNPFHPDSVNNPFGRYGSPFSPNSINDPFSRDGSPFSPEAE